MVFLGIGEKLTLLIVIGYTTIRFFGWNVSIAIVVLLSIAQLLRLIYDANYWRRLGIPGPFSIIGWETTVNLLRLGAHNCDSENRKKYGKIFGSFFFMKKELYVSDPELLKKILIKDFWNFSNRREVRDIVAIDENSIFSRSLSALRDERWRTVRNAITPTFTTGKMKLMVPLVQDGVDVLCELIEKISEDGVAVDVANLTGNFTMDVIAAVAFAIKEDNQRNPDTPFMNRVKRMSKFSFTNWRMLLLFFFPALISRLAMYFKVLVALGDAEKYFTEHLKAVVKQRRQNPKVNEPLEIELVIIKSDRPDFLQLMLNVSDNNETEEEAIKLDGEIAPDNVRKQHILSDLDIISQCFLFLFAGHETTSATFTYACYLLAVHSDIEERLYDEIANVTGDKPITYEQLQQQLPYLDAVLMETLRLYPVATRFDRNCDSDYQLTDKMTIPKGTTVVVPVYAMHHDPEYFPDPEKFDPDRFLGHEKSIANSMTYLPFGAGNRNCVGMRFAQMELKLALANIVKRFRIEPSTETEVPLQLMKKTAFLKPDKPVKLLFKKRDYDFEEVNVSIGNTGI